MGTLQVFTVGGGTLDISTAQLERDPEKVGVLPKATQLGKARTQTSLALRHLALKPLIHCVTHWLFLLLAAWALLASVHEPHSTCPPVGTPK